jgi:hypothetical protein
VCMYDGLTANAPGTCRCKTCPANQPQAPSIEGSDEKQEPYWAWLKHGC